MSERLKSNFFRKACYWMIAVGILNFGVFVAGATYLGGDAVNGKVRMAAITCSACVPTRGTRSIRRSANPSLHTASGTYIASLRRGLS